MISTKLKEYLHNAGVRYAGNPRPVYTSEEIAQSVPVPALEMVKSVILKAEENDLVMAVVSANTG